MIQKAMLLQLMVWMMFLVNRGLRDNIINAIMIVVLGNIISISVGCKAKNVVTLTGMIE